MLTGQKQVKENKKIVEGQFDMFNFKLAEIAHEIDKINLKHTKLFIFKNVFNPIPHFLFFTTTSD